MTDDERSRKRKEHEDDEADVEAHVLETDEPNDDDPERKRKEWEDTGDELGRKRK
jgi:hypothetical protein